MRDKLRAHMPKCLAELKPKPRKPTKPRITIATLNARLEEAARDIERLARNMPAWGPALSSAAERVREKKIDSD